MIHAVARGLKTSWKSLVLTDILFKLIAFAILAPLVSILFRAFLASSGRTVVADADIANFLLHPIGWATLVIVGGASLCILALEQSALMTISLAAAHRQDVNVFASLRFVAGKSAGILSIAARMVVRILVLAAPFLAVGGGIYVFLLTDQDINYYLSEKPPRFWVAAVSIGAILVALAFLILRCVTSWAIALPLHLYERLSPGQCLSTSRQRLMGHRATVARWVVTWALVNGLLATVATGLVLRLGQWVVPLAAGSVWQLSMTVGSMLLLWNLVNFVTSLLAAISFAVMLGHAYDRFGRTEAFALPENREHLVGTVRMTGGRVVSASIILVLAAFGIGATALHSIQLEDHAEVTAHRGASGRAPENTLASVQAAIEDKTDWVEIDVQESSDGVVVVAHDSDLKKVSGNGAKIWDATADELRAIDIGSSFAPEFADQRVPTLAEVLQTCKGKVRVNIELKYYGHNQDLERKVIDLVEEHGMARDVVIMSLKSEGIQKVKQLRPDWTVGLLTAVAFGNLTSVEADFLAVNGKLATREFIRSAHQKGKKVYVWTVNDRIGMSTMLSRGADMLITDHPALAKRVLAERAQMSPVERILVDFAYRFGIVPAKFSQQ